MRFRPATPMRAQSADVELELQNVRIGLAPEIVLTSRTSVPHAIRRGFLTVPTRAPCSGGAEFTSVTIDGDSSRAGTLQAGIHTLRAESPDRMNGYSLEIVADFEMADGVCVRTPLLSQSIPLVPAPRLVLVLGAGAEGNQALAGVKASADFHVGAGATLGPVLLTAQVGGGTVQCVAAVCGPGEGDKAVVAAAFRGSLTAIRGFSFSGSALRGSMLTVGGRYSFITTRLPAVEASRRLDFHSLEALVGWGFGVGFDGPFRRREMTPVIEVAIPFGVMAEQASPSQVALVVGVETRFLIDL